jgi:DNA polymerase-3 subunit delta'
MNAWGLFGHDWAVEHLRKAMQSHRIRHAYLFTGVEQVGKRTLATAFAAALNCLNIQFDPSGSPLDPRPCGECASCRRIISGNHPDIIWAQHDPATGALKIEEIRVIIRQLALKPFEARYRIAILPDFDRAQPRAQDALLKTLEEPAPRALMLLLTAQPAAVLPTITSRSQVVRLRAQSADTVRAALVASGADPDQADLLARLSAGRVGWALSALHQPDTLDKRTRALDLLDQVLASNRAERFRYAEDFAKDKDKQVLNTLLSLWMSFWRDLVVSFHNHQLPLVNIDRADRLAALRAALSSRHALRALDATQSALRSLDTNASPRLIIEVMFLDYPGL